ncbi:histidine kinase [Paenibacillus sp. FSL H8-0537]|uniref:sensor histidine kinase n=1 Tax=Paenibacillus sp. FSL H8-0537 TaxID=2921399 RepID=UPI00310162CE
MDAGNWISPLIVFVVTLLLITRLFTILEAIQEELQQARLIQMALQEREKLAKELHDGVAQSLFLVSVQLEQLKPIMEQDEKLLSIKNTVREVNEYVRQSISHLKYPPEVAIEPWNDSISNLINELHFDSDINTEYSWPISEINLTDKEKIALYAFIREGLLNIRKHAKEVNHIRIRLESTEYGWTCRISDNGLGFTDDPLLKEGSYGLKFLEKRTIELGWELQMRRESERTVLEVIQREAGVA